MAKFNIVREFNKVNNIISVIYSPEFTGYSATTTMNNIDYEPDNIISYNINIHHNSGDDNGTIVFSTSVNNYRADENKANIKALKNFIEELKISVGYNN